MTNLTLTAEQIAVSLEDKDGELRLDSRIVCAGFGLPNHTSYRTNILMKYEKAFARFGVILKMTLEWHFYAAGPCKDPTSKKCWTTGTAKEKDQIIKAIQTAMEWSDLTGYPTWVGAWMATNYKEDDNILTFADGAPAGGDYSQDEQIAFAGFMVEQLMAAEIPSAVNSDTKYFDRHKAEWYKSVKPVLDVIL